MPIIKSKYSKRPWYFINGHFETIVPSLFFVEEGVAYTRERLELIDGDFLDLDWVKAGNKRLIILSHGLEGSADRHYIKRPARYFSQRGWDVLAWNNRSCSGVMNRLPRFYHHGATEDIGAVVTKALEGDYEEIVMIGYSMGGGMQQKYLGERKPDDRIKGAVSFSVPCNVQDSAFELKKGFNKVYEKRFISKLKEKILLKAEEIEMPVDLERIRQAKNFKDLDEEFTLKVHTEYVDADDFYSRITSDQFLPNLEIPLLIVNALNDPMLGSKCYPVELAEQKPNIFLEMPKKGGHVGFILPKDSYSYMEYASDSFIKEVINPFAQKKVMPR